MDKLSFEEARHLVTRTGLGPEWIEIKRLQGKPMPLAVKQILQNRNSSPPAPPRLTPWSKIVALKNNVRGMKSIMRISRVEGEALQKWWVNHLLHTKAPFLERMTLFWHNVFPSTIGKTQAASLLHQQNLMLRKHALGDFRVLFKNVAKDPAMLVYLDGYKNVQENPNENFAREALELFTVGRRYFREQDIREAARAFTGWGVDPRSGRFVFNAGKHDTGKKTLMGKSGSLNGDQALDIMLNHPATAERVAERFWSEFISSSRPNPATVKRWANSFMHSGYNIEGLLNTVLTSDEFWSTANRGARIKSPVELAVGTLRALPYTLPRNNLAHQLMLLGQSPFDQPSVKGWVGGNEWINTQSLMLRNAMLRNMTRGVMRSTGKSAIDRQLPDVQRQQLTQWLLPVAPLRALPEQPGKQRLVRALVLDPAYQVT